MKNNFAIFYLLNDKKRLIIQYVTSEMQVQRCHK